MTKNNEQKIIDDLDTRCPYHCSDKVGQCNNPSQETPHTYCIDNKDCIYKLKEENNTLFKAIEEVNKINKRLESENEHLAEKEEEARYYLEEAVKLKQTLEEIREIAEEKKKVGDWLAFEILQKINEVEDEESI